MEWSPQSEGRVWLEPTVVEGATGTSEIDNALFAPEPGGEDCTPHITEVLLAHYRRESIAPQVAPGEGIQTYYESNPPPEVVPDQGIQTFYDSNPPEAIVMTVDTSANSACPNSAESPRGHHGKAKVLASLVVMFLVAGLSTGLGIGLARRANADNHQASPTASSSQHRILNGTALSALSLPNGNRTVFFQEETGDIRQISSSSQAGIWAANRTLSDPIAFDARKNTPLTAISYPGVDETLYSTNRWYLFYVSARDTLTCVQWNGASLVQPPCFFFSSSPDIKVASDYRQISVAPFPTKVATDLLMVYQDHSQIINFLQGSLSSPNNWTWSNVTSRFTSGVADRLAIHNVSLTGPCASHSSSSSSNESPLYCIVRGNEESNKTHDAGLLVFDFLITYTGNLKIVSCDLHIESNGKSFRDDSDIVIASGGQALWSNQGSLEIEDRLATNSSALQAANPSFRHSRLATAFTDSVNSSYIYRQLSDSIITENYLHISSTISINSTNISIELS